MNVMHTSKDDTIAAAGTSAQPYFSVRDLHAYYGESYIVQGVSFDIAEREIVALLGRNGAGKTSTLRAIARANDPVIKSGEIHLQGNPVHGLVAYQAARAGIQLVPEDRRIIAGLTVEENLVLSQIAEPIGWSLDRIYEHFPPPARTPQAGGGNAFGWRAADVGRRQGACPRSQTPAVG